MRLKYIEEVESTEGSKIVMFIVLWPKFGSDYKHTQYRHHTVLVPLSELALVRYSHYTNRPSVTSYVLRLQVHEHWDLGRVSELFNEECTHPGIMGGCGEVDESRFERSYPPENGCRMSPNAGQASDCFVAPLALGFHVDQGQNAVL